MWRLFGDKPLPETLLTFFSCELLGGDLVECSYKRNVHMKHICVVLFCGSTLPDMSSFLGMHQWRLQTSGSRDHEAGL